MSNLEELYKIYPLYRELFPEQLAFVLEPAQYSAALCTRRAGKTTVCGIDLVQQALTTPGSMGLYLALTDKTVTDIFIPAIRPIINKYKIDCKINSDCIIFPNGSQILLFGANHVNKIETFRGFKLWKCVIDESASFKDKILSYLIDEIIDPALTDVNGKLKLIGTPAEHCSGIFYDVTVNPSEEWKIHRWSGLDNPHIVVNFKARMEAFLKRKRCDETNAKYRREYLGEWAADTDELMFRPFHVVPAPMYDRNTWKTTIGVDVGFNDETAMTVIGWKYNNPKAYILKSIGFTGYNNNEEGLLTRIADTLKRLKADYNPSSIVMDYAGASKILMEHFSRKHMIHIENAEKHNKAHYIELLNDSLINEEILLVDTETKELQSEMKKLVWNEERTREREGMKCDRIDATLYAFRAAKHYLEKIPVIVVETPDAKLKKMEEQAIQSYYAKAEANNPNKFYDDLEKYIERDM